MNKKKSDIIVRVSSIAGKCKYHQRIGQEYSLEKLVPQGMCLNAFHVAYAYCLGLAYGAVFSWMRKIDRNAVIAQCPFGIIVMEIKRFRNNKHKKIIIKIVDKRGECEKGIKPGQKFLFNLGQDNTIMCPAGFNSIFPYLLMMKHKKIKEILIECPDHINRVVYEIIRRKSHE